MFKSMLWRRWVVNKLKEKPQMYNIKTKKEMTINEYIRTIPPTIEDMLTFLNDMMYEVKIVNLGIPNAPKWFFCVRRKRDGMKLKGIERIGDNFYDTLKEIVLDVLKSRSVT